MSPTLQGSGLTQERSDEVAPVDEHSWLAPSSFGAFDHFAVPNKLQFSLPDAHSQPFPRITGRNRVGLLAHSAEGFAAHSYGLLVVLWPACRRQRSQRATFLFEAFAPTGITFTQKLEQKPFVLRHAGELPVPSQT
jgi:hypothetical protein